MAYTLQEQYNSKNFTPKANVLGAFGYPPVKKWITIHHWGNKGQKFDTVRDFLCNNNTPTSAHYVAQDGLVACIVSPEDAAWHAGNAQGNAQSVGIECRPEATDGDYQTVAELISSIRAVYGDLPLKRHSDWTSTACPGDYDLARLDSLARNSTPQVPENTSEEIDVTAKDEILARIEQVVAWEADRFKEVNAKIDQRVNDLAGWTRDDANSVKGTVQAVTTAGTVDVNALAEQLKANLAADVARELGRKLASDG